MSILYIAVDKLPENCAECPHEKCPLPLGKGRRDCTVLTPYRKKRHKDCPLKEVSVDENK